MTLLTVFQEAATVIGMDVPDSVYGSSAREHQEIAVLANTMGRRIARAYEWQELKRTTWPGRREVYGTTLVVIVMVLLCAVFLYGVDVVLQPIAQIVYPTTR